MKQDKIKNKDILAFRIDAATLKKLEEIAAKEDRKVSSFVRYIVKKYIEKYK